MEKVLMTQIRVVATVKTEEELGHSEGFKSSDGLNTFATDMFAYCRKRLTLKAETIKKAKEGVITGVEENIFVWHHEWLKDFKKARVKLPIKVAGHPIKNVTKDGFNIGCTKITWKEYDAVGKLRPKRGKS